MESDNLKKEWFDRALQRAGIAHESWRPSRGVDENRRVVEAVYTYYGQLFLEYPYLQWAGMAAMIGPAFYAGFRDLGLVPDAARRTVATVFGQRPRQLARDAAGDPGFYETTFLTMQKKIFEDQASMHEAYLIGGMPQVEALYQARIIDVATLTAWRQIDTGRRSGDEAAVASGNRALLFREQYDIIDRFYVQMLDLRWLEGRAFTYLLTLAGAPSIPGAHSYPERYPLKFGRRLWRAAISTRTPLADGNIAIFADRWKLIDADTLPRYLTLVLGDLGQVQQEVRIPIAQRMKRYRLLARAPQLALGALTRWGVDISAAPGRPDAFASRLSATSPSGTGGSIAIDLTHPPTREVAGLTADTDSRVWMNPAREPINVAVSLPGGRTYRARAAMAVMLSSTRAGNPDRLTVQLLPSGLDAAWQLIGKYAAEWGFPPEEAARWRASAGSLASSGPGDATELDTYSTHVFTPDDVGFVHLEFQVSHHIREGEFVVVAQFSWTDQPPERS
jgi:hypothetical protein